MSISVVTFSGFNRSTLARAAGQAPIAPGRLTLRRLRELLVKDEQTRRQPPITLPRLFCAGAEVVIGPPSEAPPAIPPTAKPPGP